MNNFLRFNFFAALTRYDGDTLELTNVQRQEMGNYLCIASNGVPPSVSKRYSIHVHCTYLQLVSTKTSLRKLHRFNVIYKYSRIIFLLDTPSLELSRSSLINYPKTWWHPDCLIKFLVEFYFFPSKNKLISMYSNILSKIYFTRFEVFKYVWERSVRNFVTKGRLTHLLISFRYKLPHKI